ncbi:helix-turn-helix domain-containing protein [Streptomyces parvus]|uniref:helix-turn-helix domain-containing protein n=1 Tax=Streptomyces parvus TaxID=66428 RepID=UPI002100B8A3|nr:helix-turn-helix transcriptional regulator [Streptomyces parvus]MCQ1579270.1 helix-turn-helix transcriptional regulator [Streptomyces parvus]
MKWNLRWAAAKRDIWRPSQLKVAFEEVGFTPSLSKVAALWSGKPVTVRLDDLDMICTALQCTVADLMEAEPVAAAGGSEQEDLRRAVGESPRAGSGGRPVPKQTGSTGAVRRSLPPN